MKNPADLDRLEEQIAAELPAMVQRDQRRAAAFSEATVRGQLRRALHDAGIRLPTAAAVAGVSDRDYADWLTGDAPLPSTAIDWLAELVHLHLAPVN